MELTLIEMKEMPCLDYAERLTDDALIDEINELEHDIFRMLEDYCIDNGWGVRAYMDMTSHVRNLTACAWVAGRRNLKAIGKAEIVEEEDNKNGRQDSKISSSGRV